MSLSFGSFPNAPRRRPAPRPAKRPTVEGLEDRTLLSLPAGPVLHVPEFGGDEAFVVRLSPADLRTVQVSVNGGATFQNAPLTSTGSGRIHGAFVVAGPNPARPPFAFVILEDLDGDGLPDLAANFGSTLRVALGRADGTFEFALEMAQEEEASPLSVSVGDFTGDGKTDILTLSTARDGGLSLVGLLRGNGDGTFEPDDVPEAGVLTTAFSGLSLDGKIQEAALYQVSVNPALAQAGRPSADAGLGGNNRPAPRSDREPSPPAEAARPAPSSSAAAPAEAPAARPEGSPAAGRDQALAPPALGLVPDSPPPSLHGPADGSRPETPAVESAALAPAEPIDPAPPATVRTPGPEEARPAEAVAAVVVLPVAPPLPALPALLDRAGSGPNGDAVLDVVFRQYLGEPQVPREPDPHEPPPRPPARGEDRLGLSDLGPLVAQALYLGSLKHADANQPPTPAAVTLDGVADSRMLLADLLQRSTEAFTRLVKGFFLTFLDRPAADGEEAGWVGMLLSGQTEEQVLAAFLGTAEFYSRAAAHVPAGTPDERFVQALYRLLLRRPATEAELSNWLGALPGLGRSAVASFLLTSNEYRALQIDAYFRDLAGRSATAAEVAAWAASPLNLLDVRNLFETRPELFGR